MKLRKWQSECIKKAVNTYSSGAKHFLALATPGAGKTICATKLARELIDLNMVDLVVCFSPTSMVASDFSDSLSEEFGSRFDGRLGAMGYSTTYQNMQFLDHAFWALLKEYRVFVIFDEIHHCSGSKVENANAWGEQIILNIQTNAKYSLALTGTPWRSDKTPIVMASYCDVAGKIICDYEYGLKEAIKDSVCRLPQITILDNDDINVTHKDESKSFDSFLDLLKHSLVSYQSVIGNDGLIKELIQRADLQLNEIRQVNPNAGGLIVASSVEHAREIQKCLQSTLKESATIVTYREELPNQIIKEYRSNNSKWLISVGMVSEGTNIPRLQVCIHLTNIKTELHFRQILGRILRFTITPLQVGYLFMPAHPELVEFAYRIANDVPEEVDIVNFEKLSEAFQNKYKESKTKDNTETVEENKLSNIELSSVFHFNKDAANGDSKSPLSESYEKMVGIFGRFRDEVLELSIFDEPPINN